MPAVCRLTPTEVGPRLPTAGAVGAPDCPNSAGASGDRTGGGAAVTPSLFGHHSWDLKALQFRPNRFPVSLTRVWPGRTTAARGMTLSGRFSLSHSVSAQLRSVRQCDAPDSDPSS